MPEGGRQLRRYSTSKFAEALSPITYSPPSLSLHAGSPPTTSHNSSPATSSDTAVESEKPSSSRWNLNTWSRKKWLLIFAIAVSLIAAITVGAVLGIKFNAYPNYKGLQYTLYDDYSGAAFFEGFNYFTDPDPTHGYVDYVDETTAQQNNLTYASDTSAILRVDTSAFIAMRPRNFSYNYYDRPTWTIYDTDSSSSTVKIGRRSVRIQSKKQYNEGLFIFDVKHSPYGCATWPALWLVDHENFPNNSEIDVMEEVNRGNDGNSMTLHTSKGCSMNVRRKQTGQNKSYDCWNTTNFNEGCSVRGEPTELTYGEGFNDRGGGIYTTELRSDGIRIWFFPRASLPSDLIDASSPNPASWPSPQADFPYTHCNPISKYFRNLSIVVNIAICGDWAGNPEVYGKQCPGTCQQYVEDEAEAFVNAYWELGSVRVYQAVRDGVDGGFPKS